MQGVQTPAAAAASDLAAFGGWSLGGLYMLHQCLPMVSTASEANHEGMARCGRALASLRRNTSSRRGNYARWAQQEGLARRQGSAVVANIQG